MKNGRGGRNVDPITYTGNEEFAVKITDEEVEQLKDENGDIRFHKVIEWCIQKFDGESYWEWLAARMRNYMVHLMATEEWKPRYYDPIRTQDKIGRAS